MITHTKPSFVLQGTCGWSDQQYPISIKKDTASKLKYYSENWPCVEVNSSCYMILPATTAASWCSETPCNFTFTFKAFGLFCSRSINCGNLPVQVRTLLQPNNHRQQQRTTISLHEMPQAAINTTWDLFNKSLEPFYSSNRLGPVIFQFHLSFTPSTSNLNYVLDCRQRLDPRYKMSVEFRCRRWFTDAGWKEQAHSALAMQGISWVAADELEHETYQKDKEQRGLPPGAVRKVLPIALEVTTSEFFYIRVHRRHGFQDRRLEEDEIQEWVERITSVSKRVIGPIYFFWGTDHKNVPQLNRSALQGLLPEDMQYDWKVEKKGKSGSLMALLNTAAAKRAVGGNDDDDDDDDQPHEAAAAAARGTKHKRGIKRYFQSIAS